MKKETQQHLIACLTLGGIDAMTTCVQAGIESAWFDAEHVKCYTAALEMFSKGKGIDAWTLKRKVEELGGKDMTMEFAAWGCDVPTLTSLPDYIAIAENERAFDMAIQEHKRTTVALEKIDHDDVMATVAQIQASWSRVGLTAKQAERVPEVARDLIDEWAKPIDESGIVPIRWPLIRMNEHIGPVEDELIVIGARPSIGKTAFVVQWLVMLGYDNIKGSLASLESRIRKIAMRAIAIAGRVNTIDLRRHKQSGDMAGAIGGYERLKSSPIEVSDCGMTIDQLRAWALCQKALGSKLLIVDNMKHIRTRSRYSSPVEQFRDISAKLKWIRDDVGLPLVVLHHLNKELELSWSDDIERDADIIIRMSENERNTIEPCKSNHWMGRCIVDFEIKKNREGKRGLTMPAEFKKEIQTFEDWDM